MFGVVYKCFVLCCIMMRMRVVVDFFILMCVFWWIVECGGLVCVVEDLGMLVVGLSK